jgi:hypothetical protein
MSETTEIGDDRGGPLDAMADDAVHQNGLCLLTLEL